MTKLVPPDNALSIYDGQTWIGWAVQRGDKYIAFAADGRRLGSFDTLPEVTAAKFLQKQEAPPGRYSGK